FIGRRAELEMLGRSVVSERARLLVLSGMGGIGKTTTAARLSREVAADFQRVYWRSLRDAPPFDDWSAGAIGFLADHQRIPPDGRAARSDLLIELMRVQRCLLILDNLEAPLQSGEYDSSFRPGYEAYAT